MFFIALIVGIKEHHLEHDMSSFVVDSFCLEVLCSLDYNLFTVFCFNFWIDERESFVCSDSH